MKKAAATLRCSEKKVLPERIKVAIKRCSPPFPRAKKFFSTLNRKT